MLAAPQLLACSHNMGTDFLKAVIQERERDPFMSSIASPQQPHGHGHNLLWVTQATGRAGDQSLGTIWEVTIL